jgi:hypothetical protein
MMFKFEKNYNMAEGNRFRRKYTSIGVEISKF